MFTVLQGSFTKKTGPKTVIFYRTDVSKYDNKTFENELQECLSKSDKIDLNLEPLTRL